MIDPVAIGLGFVHSTGAIGNAIALTTTPIHKVLSRKARAETATHVFVWFRDAHGAADYFEALEGKGWRGPLPLAEVHAWAAAEKGRWVKEYDLSAWFSHDEIRFRHEFCHRMLSVWTYNVPQLALQLRMATSARKILGRSLFKATPNQVICSEAGSLICSNPPVLDFSRWCGCDYDYIVPQTLMMACENLIKDLSV